VSTLGGKKYHSELLVESYRESNTIKHRTIANLSHCSPEEIDAIDFALKNKKDLASCVNLNTSKKKQGKSIGAIFVLNEVAKRLGIVDAFGTSREANLCLWMTIGRLIQPGQSRLAAVRLSEQHAIRELLGLDEFSEDDLYNALDWLDLRRKKMETRLFSQRFSEAKPILYMYDVTSSYLEGTENEYAAFGYGRDKKEGKMQIVIGLLTDAEGWPISVEVFEGNTLDFYTFYSQVRKLANQFGCEQVAMVGDKGMIKSAQIEDIQDHNFLYITTITKAQIEKLLKQGTFQMELFTEELHEVKSGNDRFILRRNPVRAKQIVDSRKDRLEVLNQFILQQNEYLIDHPRAELEVALRKINERIDKLCIDEFVKVQAEGRNLQLLINRNSLEGSDLLDGCYVVRSNIPLDAASKETIHGRYKALSHVEDGFRIMKTEFLEIRPLFLRLASRTRAHVFIVMLSYMIAKYLEERWKTFDLTVKEAVAALAAIHPVTLEYRNTKISFVPEPLPIVARLIDALDLVLPPFVPSAR